MIIFEGDWVKVGGDWSQVFQIDSSDSINIFRGGFIERVIADEDHIERVVSDPEMQNILRELTQ